MKSLRVLHVINGFNHGGVESWLLQLARKANPNYLKMDFAVHQMNPGAYDKEIVSRGCRIGYCPSVKNPIEYQYQLRNLIRQFGPFDAVHSHLHHFSGWVLVIAKREGVPVRIAHSHNDTRLNDARSGLIRKAYLKITQKMIFSSATLGLAASDDAGKSLFGTHWGIDNKLKVLRCSVDLDSYNQVTDRLQIRSEFGLSDSTMVIGHVGRFVKQKNHSYLLKIAVELKKMNVNAKFLLIGDGTLLQSIRNEAVSLGVNESIIFAGNRSDVPKILAAMDVFVFPSLFEGLPLAAVEAQACALPVLFSTSVPKEAAVIPDIVSFLPLQEDPSNWAKKIITIFNDVKYSHDTALKIVRSSQFNTDRALEKLIQYYSGNYLSS